MRVIGIIPARYNSSRFPGKPLADIMGMSMIQRVYEQASKCKLLNKVIVATDDERISFHVKSFGGTVMITSKKHESGTDRCGEVVEKLEEHFDIIVNIQGDEPFIDPQQITELITLFEEQDIKIATLAKKIEDFSVYTNENKVKVFFDENNTATSFERKYLLKEEVFNTEETFKHIGIYAFREDILEKIIHLKPTKKEKELNLEQVRWMDHNYNIKVGITDFDPISVDQMEDIKKISRSHLKNN
jgi:3-deoxy-manno-octulosonate cytidylyltransferase (CMP-KDO synthetase)